MSRELTVTEQSPAQPIDRRMLEGLGAQTREITAPFQPEHGAYHAHPH